MWIGGAIWRDAPAHPALTGYRVVIAHSQIRVAFLSPRLGQRRAICLSLKQAPFLRQTTT